MFLSDIYISLKDDQSLRVVTMYVSIRLIEKSIMQTEGRDTTGRL